MKVTSKAQVTIPLHTREDLGINPAETEVEFVKEENGNWYLRKLPGQDKQPSPFRTAHQVGRLSMTTEEIVGANSAGLMAIILVDTCVISDLGDPNGEWFEWSAANLERLNQHHRLVIDPIIYSEYSIGYKSIEETEKVIQWLGFDVLSTFPGSALLGR